MERRSLSFYTNNKEEQYAKIASLLAAETERAAMPCEKQKSTAILSARRVRTSGREWESEFANGYECGEDSLPSVVLWTAEKGIQRERLAHDFAPQSIVCYTVITQWLKTGVLSHRFGGNVRPL